MEYANELQIQIQDKKEKKEREAVRLRLMEEQEEQRIRAELNVLNERERIEMLKERGQTAPVNQPASFVQQTRPSIDTN